MSTNKQLTNSTDVDGTRKLLSSSKCLLINTLTNSTDVDGTRKLLSSSKYLLINTLTNSTDVDGTRKLLSSSKCTSSRPCKQSAIFIYTISDSGVSHD